MNAVTCAREVMAKVSGHRCRDLRQFVTSLPVHSACFEMASERCDPTSLGTRIGFPVASPFATTIPPTMIRRDQKKCLVPIRGIFLSGIPKHANELIILVRSGEVAIVPSLVGPVVRFTERDK